jgi:protein involved in polysaccharide export with SLBB domain
MRRLLLVLFATAGLSAAAQTQSLTNPVTLGSAPLPSFTSTGMLGIANLSGYVPDDKYKLRVGDRLSFQILEDRDAPKSLAVTDSGEMDLPYVGRVQAKDKTCKQLAQEVKALLEKAYYIRATVIFALDVQNRLMGRIYVIGQVRTQGALEVQVNENMTVSKAVMRAGGLGDFANKKKVRVVRSAIGPGGTNQTFIVNLGEILDEGKTEKDLPLEPDDFVIVPTRLINL